MKNIDKRVDVYIEKSAEFSRPILKHLRELVHRACPDVTETIKWGIAYFDYKGVLCSMAAFKGHVAFGFWKESLMPGIKEAVKNKEYAMGSLGRISGLSDLPADAVLMRFIKEAARLNDEGVKAPQWHKSRSQELHVPDYFIKAVSANKRAFATFEGFSFTNKREYVEWVVGAKSEETRERRLRQAVEWMSEGKIRYWKYMGK